MDVSISTVRTIIELDSAKQSAHNDYMRAYFPSGVVNFREDKHHESKEYLEYRERDKELVNFMRDLDYSRLLDVEALMIFGRGDSDTFEQSRANMQSTFPDPGGKDAAIEYMTSKAVFGRYLRSGLDKL